MDKQIMSALQGIILAAILALIISFFKTIVFDNAADNDNFLSRNPFNGAASEDIHEQNVSNADTNENDLYSVKSNLAYKDDKLVNINIEPLEEFSGLSVNEILSMRKEAVKSSPLFGNMNYSPNADVFLIQDGLQWISAHEVSCNGADNNLNIGRGKSRESLAILNPELLYYITVPAFKFSASNIKCSKEDYTIPYRANYTPSDNTIHVYINYAPVKEKLGYFGNIVMADANARDLGYNYAYASNSSNISFRVNKFNQELIKTRGYYHKGYACGLSAGCNNYSPFETGYEFYLTDLPARLYIKLWHDRPTSVSQNADINYEMIFE